MESEDDLETETRNLRDLEFRAGCGLCGDREVEECRVRIETVKRSIAAALSEEPIRAQFALISRFAERKRLPYDSVANVWILANSGHFRTLWDNGERDLDAIGEALRKKTGY